MEWWSQSVSFSTSSTCCAQREEIWRRSQNLTLNHRLWQNKTSGSCLGVGPTLERTLKSQNQYWWTTTPATLCFVGYCFANNCNRNTSSNNNDAGMTLSFWSGGPRPSFCLCFFYAWCFACQFSSRTPSFVFFWIPVLHCAYAWFDGHNTIEHNNRPGGLQCVWVICDNITHWTTQ